MGMIEMVGRYDGVSGVILRLEGAREHLLWAGLG